MEIYSKKTKPIYSICLQTTSEKSVTFSSQPIKSYLVCIPIQNVYLIKIQSFKIGFEDDKMGSAWELESVKIEYNGESER